MSNTERRKWPWNHPLAFMLSMAIFIGGLMLEFVGVRTLNHFGLGSAWLQIIVLSVFLAVMVLFSSRLKAFQFFRSPAAVFNSSIFFAIACMILGFFPQSPLAEDHWIGSVGFNRVLETWYFQLSALYLLLVIGCASFYRLFRLKTFPDVVFLSNHFGLFLVIAFMAFGNQDRLELHMFLDEEQDYVWYAYDSEGEVHELSFAFKLNDFVLEEYPSKIAMAGVDSSMIVNRFIYPQAAVPGGKISMGEYEFEVLQLEQDVLVVEDSLVYIHMPGAVNAVRLKVHSGLDLEEFWLTTGNLTFPPQIQVLNDGRQLVLMNPMPKRFMSDLSYHTQSQKSGRVEVEVNKPFTIDGWKVYQKSYDNALGRWSPTSTLELVFDPWRKFVYAGFFLLMLGAILQLFILSNKRKS